MLRSKSEFSRKPSSYTLHFTSTGILPSEHFKPGWSSPDHQPTHISLLLHVTCRNATRAIIRYVRFDWVNGNKGCGRNFTFRTHIAYEPHSNFHDHWTNQPNHAQTWSVSHYHYWTRLIFITMPSFLSMAHLSRRHDAVQQTSWVITRMKLCWASRNCYFGFHQQVLE